MCFLKVVLHFDNFCCCFTNVPLEDTPEALNEALVYKVPETFPFTLRKVHACV